MNLDKELYEYAESDRNIELQSALSAKDKEIEELKAVCKGWEEGHNLLIDRAEKAEAERDEAVKVVDAIVHELGVPNENYPAPVSNAYTMAVGYLSKQALTEEESPTRQLRDDGHDEVCLWAEDDVCWMTSCGNAWGLITGTPVQNGMKFCPFCGKKLEEEKGEGDENTNIG